MSIFVDAAYLMRGAGAALAHGTIIPPRSDIGLDPVRVSDLLRRAAGEVGVHPGERIGWYDGFRPDRPLSLEQRSLADSGLFELQLGPLREHRGVWTQKRVDALIQRDMVRAARAGVRDIMLVAGDEDLTVAAEECAELGTRVHVFGIDARIHHSCSVHLRLACEDEHMLTRSDVVAAFGLKARAGIGQIAAVMNRVA